MEGPSFAKLISYWRWNWSWIPMAAAGESAVTSFVYYCPISSSSLSASRETEPTSLSAWVKIS
jgi:hypothetical protein